MTYRSTKHPALTMSKQRAQAWQDHATPDTYFEYLDALRVLYARYHYKDDGVLDEEKLFNDFQEWKAERSKDEW